MTTTARQLTVTAPGDLDIVMTRAFDAPRSLVFDAFTKPDIVSRWLLGPDGWSMPVCEIDLRAGGAYRYMWRHEARGREMGCGGTFREVTPPERLVYTERFDDPWYEGEALCTVVFAEQDGLTVVEQAMRFTTKAVRDAVLATPMETGVARSYDRLEAILADEGDRSRPRR